MKKSKKGKNKTAQVKKSRPQPRKPKTVKKDFLTKRKDINDKFFDLIGHHTKKVNKKGKWVLTGVGKLAKELEVSPSTIKRYIDTGSINTKNDNLFINIERNFDKLKLPRSKKYTKQFTVHNFTESNFFPPKNMGRTKKYEQFYFRAGLYIVFEKIRERSRGRKKAGTVMWTYTIQNMPVSFYHNNFKQGYKLFFEKIKADLQQYPSLKYFRVNYLDVTKIDLRK